ncbi:30S ribosomal protein S12 methylthiotransferase RimO [Leptospira wolffii]|uniref:30S ribosomal protein S12 methylthiotransferase RimO n=1 Tax=Leptospira wolffii TaxID=409998 RepID=UPI001083ED0B|nr:30S ribosomal protein S12 methylthiotransferase RimO [Leptospira wolffii]TGK60263.1 30S ribosomal protein S12 methylthiotransferase RimO [Leptospira wolffii]TGK72605.1 30S ribosomal protein S12 methylthiotransferase RimO [Leptospira wolffii]TGK76270.1 30S ribosomal protein S12 methylthiotransferase RimO [Leptospira wolffii]TGL30522.1 30S ribosomal protein S12 methylthiotransferase RimO [Leptospira wolffii]
MDKKFYITTLGCPKNTVDSMSMHHSLLEEGFSPAQTPEESDFHLINTCTFIRSATEETIQTILGAAHAKKQEGQKLVVVGCFAERYPKDISAEIPEVDLVFGTGKYSQAGRIIREAFRRDFSPLQKTEFNSDLIERMKLSPGIENYSKPYAYVKVSDGCNRGCAFCIIPSLRGKFVDSPLEEILRDTKRAVSAGAKEICLVSQDTVYYGKDSDKLLDMIRSVSEVEGLEILRLLYLYPDKKAEKILRLMGEIPKIAPYLESPLQHVSERVLKSMNRSGGYSSFRDLYSLAREVRPDLEIRTSFILGFPGETGKDVDEILRFVEETRPEKLNLFAYSPQDGTKGAEVAQTVSEKEKAKRINLIREAHLKILQEIHESRIGKEYVAIVDGIEDGTAVVRRLQDAPEIDEVVYVEDPSLKPGTIGKVKVESFYEYDMMGTWLAS